MHEHYVVRDQDGHLAEQDRRRESWTATDGWSWARQTGIDPAVLVLAPNQEWRRLRDVAPSGREVNGVLQEIIGHVSAPIERSKATMNLVSDLLGSETLPAASLPVEYRRSMVEAIALHPGVTTSSNAKDPVGRWSHLAIELTTSDATIVLYVGPAYEFLSYTGSAVSGERALKTITGQRFAKEIPRDLLAKTGSDRVKKWIPQ